MHLMAVIGTIPSIFYFFKMKKLMKIPGHSEV